MKSNESIPNRARRNRAILLLAVSSLFASTLAVPGCQRLGIRSREDGLSELEMDEDDWSPPQPNSRVPRPQFGDAKHPSRPKTANSPDHRGRSSGRTDKPELVGYGPSSDDPTESGKNPDILSTSEQKIDLEGALASVPAEYREVLRKQLELVQPAHTPGDSRESKLNSPQISQRWQSTDDELGLSTAKKNSTAIENVEIVSNSGSAKRGVSFRVTDSLPENPKSQLIDNNSEVISAVATRPFDTSLPPQAMDSKLVQASATSLVLVPMTSLPNSSATTPGNATPKSSAGTAGSATSSWRNQISQAIESLEQQIKDAPTADENLRVSQEVTLRMLYVSQRRLEEALRPIDRLTEHEQEYFQHQMQALFEASNPDAMPVRSRHWSLVMNSQRAATNHLAAVSNLEVKSIAFCTEVERYGVVTKFPKNQFQADQELLLYCEIENVAADKLREGYETQLQGSYEIIDLQGRKIADQLLPMEPEVCQNHRRDYFIVYKIYMPQQIAPGNYQLRLTVEDMKARKFGQNQMDFQIKK